MKLLITAGHNWWVVMPNFVVQEPSLDRGPEQVLPRGPFAPEHDRAPKLRAKLKG